MGESPDFFLRLLAFGDVADECADRENPPRADRPDEQLDGKFTALPVQRRQFDPRVQHRAISRHKEIPQTAVVRLTVLRRDDCLGKYAAHRLFPDQPKTNSPGGSNPGFHRGH